MLLTLGGTFDHETFYAKNSQENNNAYVKLIYLNSRIKKHFHIKQVSIFFSLREILKKNNKYYVIGFFSKNEKSAN